MVLHSRDPALCVLSDEELALRAQTTKNICKGVIPGGKPCQDHIEKTVCAFQKNNEGVPAQCTGETSHEDASIERAQHFVAVHRLEHYRSTTEGLGHLSNKRAVHSSPVPFR